MENKKEQTSRKHKPPYNKLVTKETPQLDDISDIVDDLDYHLIEEIDADPIEEILTITESDTATITQYLQSPIAS